MSADPERILFLTGKLAEPSLRRVLADLAPRAGFVAEVAVMPITVAALLTTDWIARRLAVPPGIQRVVLPGFCRGDRDSLEQQAGVPVVLGPKDLRELPEFFGAASAAPPIVDRYDIEILAEINHAPQKSLAEILQLARRYRDHGANIIDLGCDPGATWAGLGEVVLALRAEAHRVSVDSFNGTEVETALHAGAELVLSVNRSNIQNVQRWKDCTSNLEVVAIPDPPSDLDSLARTAEELERIGVRYRLDPILEPIGFGFAASLGRYLETRRRFPNAEILMGIGNLTELTDADSAGINVLLAGFCQELGIRSVLTTEVINWARSSVQEFDLARKLVRTAAEHRVLPKRLEPNLILLRDPKLFENGPETLSELAAALTDRNYRIFAERGEIHIMNGSLYLHGTDPFVLFEELLRRDAKLDPSHSFYLGYEFAKAVTALTLHKNYTQDRELRWGFLTVPETSHRG
jgi:dihydropteroate synthase-like protein